MTLSNSTLIDNPEGGKVRASHLWWAALVVALISLAVAPFISFILDYGFWTPWARATDGVRPWLVYTVQSDYPPIVPYLLTIAEAIRKAAGAQELGKLMLVCIKLPNIIAHVSGGILCWKGFAKIIGEDRARIAGLLYIISPALFFDAAIWGQYDALLSLELLAVFVAVLHERPWLTGALMGLAMATKFQAVVAGPMLAVYVWKHFGVRGILGAAVAGLSVMIIAALPHVLAGQGEGVLHSYTAAAGRFPFRSMGAFNHWYLLDGFDEIVRHMPRELARSDARLAFGLISFNRLALLSFAAYIAFVSICVWLRPQPVIFIFAQVICGFAFFMLPTQMHERYAVPAAALAAVLAVWHRKWLWIFIWLTISATLNQVIVLYRNNGYNVSGGMVEKLIIGVTFLVALGNIIAMVLVTIQFWKACRTSSPSALGIDNPGH